VKTRIIKSGRFEIAITTDPGRTRTSIIVYDNKYPYQQKLIDVELAAKQGEFKAFQTTIKVAKEVEIKQDPPKTVGEFCEQWREAGDFCDKYLRFGIFLLLKGNLPKEESAPR